MCMFITTTLIQAISQVAASPGPSFIGSKVSVSATLSELKAGIAHNSSCRRRAVAFGCHATVSLRDEEPFAQQALKARLEFAE